MIGENAPNARAEEIFEKRTFKDYILPKRGLVVLKGFFEGQEQPDKTSQPFFIYPADKGILTLGCVYSDWYDTTEQKTVRTFSIITTEANKLMAEIHNKKKRMPLIIPVRETNIFLQLLNNDFIGYKPELNKECKKCEYHANEKDERDGFENCWGDMAGIDPKIWDLYQAGKLKDDFVNLKIQERKISFNELLEVDFGNGTLDTRRLLQYENTINNTEFPSSELDIKVFLSNLTEKFVYPLHFIDFETMASALPFHKGLSPYNMFPFQWSLHTIERPDAEPIHSEYLNAKQGYPGFRFAESLMEKVGTEGTPLMWSTHENTTIRNVLRHMDLLNYNNPELKSWLISITN